MKLRTATAALAAVAALGLVATGCGNETCSEQTPPVSASGVPECFNMAANQAVQVQIGVCPKCDQGTPRCEVHLENLASDGDIQLEPLSEVCDAASCPIVNPSSCAATPVNCTFVTPAAGTYEIVVIDPNGTFRSEPFIVSASGGSTTCTL